MPKNPGCCKHTANGAGGRCFGGRRADVRQSRSSRSSTARTSAAWTDDSRNPGDIAGGPQFTHIAGYHAGIVIRCALFSLPAKMDYAALPWVTYADPELAHARLTEAEARKAGHEVQMLTWSFDMNNRAQAERAIDGLAQSVLGRNGRILGATIVRPRAGELIGTWALAISARLKIGAVASAVLPYPTLSEILRRAPGAPPRAFGWTRGAGP